MVASADLDEYNPPPRVSNDHRSIYALLPSLSVDDDTYGSSCQ